MTTIDSVRFTKAGDYYRKTVEWLVLERDRIPSNLTITASRGSRQDDLIDEHGLTYAQVFSTTEEAEASGLPIDTDDTIAIEGGRSFALVDNFRRQP